MTIPITDVNLPGLNEWLKRHRSHDVLVFSLLLLLVLPLTIQSAFAGSSTGIMEPLYVWLSDETASEWDPLIIAKQNHAAVPMIAIINPSSGPEDPLLCLEPNNSDNNKLGNGIKNLTDAGIKPIGYVSTQWTIRPSSEVEAEINDWETCQPLIEGIFFDEMSIESGDENYYRDLTNHTKSKEGFDFTVGNPGTDTLSSYINTVDNLIIWETFEPADVVTQLRGQDSAGGIGWHTNFDKDNFSYLEYNHTSPLDTNYVTTASNHVSYIYITDNTGCGTDPPHPTTDCAPFSTEPGHDCTEPDFAWCLDPWNTTSTYIETLAQTLDKPSVKITVKSEDLSGNTINGTDNTQISVFNVLARNGSTPLDYNATSGTSYTITSLDFDSFVFDHWEDSSTNPTRTVAPIQSQTYMAFYNNTSAPSTSPNYVVDLLDVYESSSTILDSGTAICLDIDMETASSCAAALTAGSTYRFEIQVANTGDENGFPTSFEFRDVVASGDVLGFTPSIQSSGCSSNTNWSTSISTDDVVSSSGTTCSIPAGGGSAEYWMVVTLDTDAADGTGTFHVTDGLASDASATTTFTVNPPPNVTLNVNSADLSGGEITGMWVELWKDGQQIETGFTPFSTTVQADVEHTVIAGSFQQTIFDHWEDESISETRPFTITQDANFTAFYQTGSTIALNNVQTTSGTVSLFPYQFTLANFNAGTGIDRLLVVGVEANNNWVTSITFGGVHLTQKVQSFNSNDAEFWYLTNPTGTADIVVTMSGPTSAVIGAYSFSGVDQANPVPTSATNIGSGNPTISLTTLYPNSWVLDSPSIWGGVTLDSPTCTPQWNINVPNAITGASSSAVQTSPGLVTCSWTASSVDNWDDVAIEVKASE